MQVSVEMTCFSLPYMLAILLKCAKGYAKVCQSVC